MKSSKTNALNMKIKFLDDSGVLIVEPLGALTAKDFEVMEAKIAPWIKEHGELRGFVVHARMFPGWIGVSAFVRHLRFLGAYHRNVRRVALAVDGLLPSLMVTLFKKFIHAKVRVFSARQISEATAWASQRNKQPILEGRQQSPRKRNEPFAPQVPGF